MSSTDGPVTLSDPKLATGDRFLKLGKIGTGGMGEIHAAKDQILGRTVALKRLKAGATANAKQYNRFVVEMQITAQLDHPNIIPVYDEHTSGSTIGYAMKLIEGKSLKEVLQEARYRATTATAAEARRSLRDRLEYLLGICDAMAYAHSRGVIHRDLKPANVMIGPYHEVYVVDWGIARPVDQADAEGIGELSRAFKTEDGIIVGTPPYMAPEQARALRDKIGPATDQYALGLILGEVFTLQRMRQGKSTDQVVIAAAMGRRKGWPNRDPRGRRMHPDLVAILERATEPEPQARYPDVGELAADVRRFLAGEAVSVRPPRLPDRIGRVMARHQVATMLIVLGSLAIAGFSTSGALVLLGAQQAWAEAREEALSESLHVVADRAHHIDNQFLVYEGHLKGLEAAAVNLLEHGRDDGETIYSDVDFAGNGPPDQSPSSIYARSVSFEHPAVKVVAGVDPEIVLPKAQRLWPIRHHFRSMLLETGGAGPEADAATVVGEQGVPILWTYVALREGMHLTYPGHGPYPADFDPRKRPWYRLSAGKHGLFWGSPYPDVNGRGLILPCTTSLYDADGDFLGVVGIELTFETVLRDLLDDHDLAPGEEAFLVDPEGYIVVRTSTPSDLPLNGLRDEQELKRQQFDGPEVVQAMMTGTSGYREADGQLVIYRKLDRLGWYYVVSGPARPAWSIE